MLRKLERHVFCCNQNEILALLIRLPDFRICDELMAEAAASPRDRPINRKYPFTVVSKGPESAFPGLHSLSWYIARKEYILIVVVSTVFIGSSGRLSREQNIPELLLQYSHRWPLYVNQTDPVRLGLML